MALVSGPAPLVGSTFRPARALAWLAGFGGLGIGLSVLYATTGRGVGCVFHAVTGWDCPLCGGTRLGAALLRGEVAAAVAWNPLVFIGLVVLTVLGVLWVLEAAGGPRIRLPRRAADRVRGVTPTGWLLVAGAVAVAYTLLRNLS
jgi:hypothetical protein